MTVFDMAILKMLTGTVCTAVVFLGLLATYRENSWLKWCYTTVTGSAMYAVFLLAREAGGGTVNPVELAAAHLLFPLSVLVAAMGIIIRGKHANNPQKPLVPRDAGRS